MLDETKENVKGTFWLDMNYNKWLCKQREAIWHTDENINLSYVVIAETYELYVQIHLNCKF